jgi:hypothetical protein
MAGDLNCVFQQAWKISPTLILVPSIIKQRKKMETKREALLAEELGNLYSNSNIFVFFKRARCKNQHHIQTKIRISMRETYSRILHISPTNGDCIARQYNSSVRSSSFLVILSLPELPWCCSWCSSHVFRHCFIHRSFQSPPKMLATKNTRRTTNPRKTGSCFYLKRKSKWLFGLSPDSALFWVISSTT